MLRIWKDINNNKSRLAAFMNHWGNGKNLSCRFTAETVFKSLICDLMGLDCIEEA